MYDEYGIPITNSDMCKKLIEDKNNTYFYKTKGGNFKKKKFSKKRKYSKKKKFSKKRKYSKKKKIF